MLQQETMREALALAERIAETRISPARRVGVVIPPVNTLAVPEGRRRHASAPGGEHPDLGDLRELARDHGGQLPFIPPKQLLLYLVRPHQLQMLSRCSSRSAAVALGAGAPKPSPSPSGGLLHSGRLVGPLVGPLRGTPSRPTGAKAAAAAVVHAARFRMGSFTSSPKIVNEDSQDSAVLFAARLSRDELLERCRTEQRGRCPVKRAFRRVTSGCQDPSKNGSPKLSEDQPNPARRCDEEEEEGVRVLRWNLVSRPCGEAVSSPDHLRVLQWNVLAQSLGPINDNFACCPHEALDWGPRRFQMLEEIVEYCPDVICLQEVDHFNFLSAALASQGYTGLFFPKPDSPCIYVPDNNGPDGCAVFYRQSKFELMSSHSRVLEVWSVQSNQVAILVNLRECASGREVSVATTHLKARKGALLSTLRDEQGKDLLHFLTSHSQGRPLVLCGDFNAEPTEPVYRTMTSNNGGLDLVSAYAEADHGQEPPYTTWKVREGEGEICHTIDYVFYTQRDFAVDAVLDFPSGEEIGEGRIPSFSYPSDHFSLVCDLRFRNPSAAVEPSE